MKSHEIRKAFLDYFKSKDHKIVASSPVVPADDPTLLFTNAGMVQFKNTFLGLEKRDYKRASTSQKCIRAGGKHNDLDNVGFTARHQTFFEMLGNFSFGDYFKEDAIAYAWEFITKTLGLDPKRLYATVFTEDNDAEKLWKKIAPGLGDRVLRFGEKDNFWSMGDTGPCGPCSELHYDRGEAIPGELNGDGDRFMEIWNLVFMQYNRDDTGKMTPLPKPSVDTGAGLERFCMVMQNVDSNYSTDLFRPLITEVEKLSGRKYSEGADGVSHRVIADHVRALTFALADNASISNEGRGYVLRRILRRGARYGHQIGLDEPFMYKIVRPLVEFMGDVYPEIKAQRGHIELVIKSEEEQFNRTLETGIARFEDIVNALKSRGSKTIPGEDVFKLYDTYGFPADLTEIMAGEKGYQIDWDGFNAELGKQRERSKDFKYAKKSIIELLDYRNQIGDPNSINGISNFVGYQQEAKKTTIEHHEKVEGNEVLILRETPFYAESGGQVGDTGKIVGDSFTIDIMDVVKDSNNEYFHIGNLVSGEIPKDNQIPVNAEIDPDRRADIKRNHTATHLLHKALKMTLGEHVNQQGSLVDDKRLRFDFSHFKAMSDDELAEVERIVGEKIIESLPVSAAVMPIDEAKKQGAVALFGEKYGEEVRVIEVRDFSKELCGGTHVDNTTEIKKFFIISESAIAAGVRRIEAITGREAVQFFARQNELIKQLKGFLSQPVEKLDDKAMAEVKNIQSEIHSRLLSKENLDIKLAELMDNLKKIEKEKSKSGAAKISEQARKLEPIYESDLPLKLFIVENQSPKDFMNWFDSLKDIHRNVSIVAISKLNGQTAITSSDIKQANTIKDILMQAAGFKGGGKPTIRGALPSENIEKAIEVVKNKF